MGRIASIITAVERIKFYDVQDLAKSPVVKGYYKDGSSTFILNQHGHIYTDDPVGQDGRWTLDRGVRAAFAFGLITAKQRDAHFVWAEAKERYYSLRASVAEIQEKLVALGFPVGIISEEALDVAQAKANYDLGKAVEACKAVDTKRARK